MFLYDGEKAVIDVWRRNIHYISKAGIQRKDIVLEHSINAY